MTFWSDCLLDRVFVYLWKKLFVGRLGVRISAVTSQMMFVNAHLKKSTILTEVWAARGFPCWLDRRAFFLVTFDMARPVCCD